MLMSPPAVVALIALPALAETAAASIYSAAPCMSRSDARGYSTDRAASGDTEVASRGAVEFRKDAGLSGSGDRSGSDTDRAHSGSRISGKDTSAVSDHGPTRAVDGDTGVGAIGVRTYPAIVGAGSGDIADCVIAGAADDDIAPSATGSIGLDAVPCGAGDSVGCSDSVYRDVAACRVSEDTASACSGDGVSASNRDVAACRGSADSITGVSGDRGGSDSD